MELSYFLCAGGKTFSIKQEPQWNAKSGKSRSVFNLINYLTASRHVRHQRQPHYANYFPIDAPYTLNIAYELLHFPINSPRSPSFKRRLPAQHLQFLQDGAISIYFYCNCQTVILDGNILVIKPRAYASDGFAFVPKYSEY